MLGINRKWPRGWLRDAVFCGGRGLHLPGEGGFWPSADSYANEIQRLYVNYALELFSCIVEKSEIVWCSGYRKQENMQMVSEGTTQPRWVLGARLSVLEPAFILSSRASVYPKF